LIDVKIGLERSEIGCGDVEGDQGALNLEREDKPKERGMSRNFSC
jgi:hypothetical protein